MTKTEAADYLRVSIRTLQRLMTGGKVEFKTVKGESGVKVTVFEREALDRYKAAAAATLSHPSVSTDNEAGIEAGRVAGSGALVLQPSLGRFSELRELAEMMRPASPAPVLPDLQIKLALTIKEAAQYSGYGEGRIRAAIEAGKLKASKGGPRGAWVIKRSDLEAWVRKL